MRTATAYLLGALCLAALVWAFAFPPAERADFTFSNGTEIKTVDPALVTGQPEGRVIRALFEGLCTWDPQDLSPLPGVAEHWEISEDKLNYTFYLRTGALWSDGSPVTAGDFVWSYGRFLHPQTGSEYAHELWYIVGARKFNSGNVEIGDAVEVELPRSPPGARPFAAGVTVRGRLAAIEAGDGAERIYLVETGGVLRRFQKGAATPGTEDYRWILYDFQQLGLKALNRRTLQIRLNHPVPYFVNLMGFYPMSPVNRQCVETHGYPAWTKPENIVTNGPYLLHWRRIRDRIRLVKNPRYWDQANVHTRVIDVLAVESTITGLNLYMTGEADWVPVVPNEIVPDLLRRRPLDFQPSPYLGTEYYLVNVQKPPLDDPRVRRALSLAVDRQEIVERILRAGQKPARSVVPSDIRRYIDYTPAECATRNLEEARRLLSDAGYPGGRGMPRIEILYNTNESHQAIAELLQSQWKRSLGIDVRLQNQDWARYLNSRRVGEFMLSRAGWIGDYVDPATFLTMFASDNPSNHSRWSNAEFDRLLAEATRERDERRRMDLFHRAERLLLDELPVIPLYFAVSRAMVRPYVHGYYPNILDTHPLKNIRVDQAEKDRILRSEGLR